jgi:hypothetical protein
MADVRRTSTTSRAALIGVAALVCFGALTGNGSAQQTTTDKTIVVTQEPGNTSAGFGFRSDDEQIQMLAQTFVAPEDGVKLKSISTYLAGTDSTAVVKIYETGDEVPLGTRLATLRVHVNVEWGPDDDWQRLPIKPAIPMETGRLYSFVLSVKGGKKGMGTAAQSGADEYTGGEYYCYCPTIMGDDADHEHYSWQSGTALQNYVRDLAFQLRFRRSPASTTSS